MTQSKAALFSNELQHLAELHKVLGHPARLAILNYLAECKTCITGDISNHIPLARTTINQHLAELKRLGLIKGDICGSKVNYCIDTSKISSMKYSMLNFFDDVMVENNQNC